MAFEESEIYIARTAQGDVMTALEYELMAAYNTESRAICCPSCHDELGQEQPLRYIPEERRFVHQNVRRDCYRDRRHSDRTHAFLQQIVLKQLRNSDNHDKSGVEYSLNRPGSEVKLQYDVGAVRHADDGIDGIVVEVQHQAGCFARRIHRKVRIAHSQNYGFYVVFSSSARNTQWYKHRLDKMKEGEVGVGRYNHGTVELGTMIEPGEKIAALRTNPLRN